MANTKISALTALTGANVAANDALPIVDTNVATTKKIDASELKTYMSDSPTLVTPNIGVATGTSLDVSGVLESGANGGTGGQLKMFGATSGDVTIKAAAAAGTATNFTFPATNGTNTYALTTNGSGVTSWNQIGLTTAVTGILPVANGGTGLSSGTSGGVPYFSASGAITSSAALAANALVIGGGAGVAPSTTTTGTGILTFLGTPSSANLASAVTDETGTGALVFGTSPTFTTSAIFPAGTDSAPGITTTGDTNTGVYFPAADTIAFTEGGAEAARVNSSGAVVIGQTGALPYTSHKLGVSGGEFFLSKETTINSSTATTIGQAGCGFFYIRDTSNGGSVIVVFEFGSLAIVSGTNLGTTVFVTGAPTATQIQLTHVFSSPNYFIQALGGSSRNNALVRISCVTPQ
jgi:hypothetical protein